MSVFTVVLLVLTLTPAPQVEISSDSLWAERPIFIQQAPDRVVAGKMTWQAIPAMTRQVVEKWLRTHSTQEAWLVDLKKGTWQKVRQTPSGDTPPTFVVTYEDSLMAMQDVRQRKE